MLKLIFAILLIGFGTWGIVERGKWLESKTKTKNQTKFVAPAPVIEQTDEAAQKARRKAVVSETFSSFFVRKFSLLCKRNEIKVTFFA